MIRVPKNLTHDLLETGLQRVAEGESELQLPVRIISDAIGGEAALFQLIATWGQSARQPPSLRTYAKDQNDPFLNSFGSTAFGLAALNFSRHVLTRSGQDISRSKTMSMAEPFVRAMHDGDVDRLRQFKKRAVPTICIDNATKLSRPTPLYTPNGEDIRNHVDLKSYLISCLKAIVPADDRCIAAYTALSDPASRLIYETVQNTHRYARVDFRGNRLLRSVRGLQVAYHYLPIAGLALSASGSLPLENYYRTWTPVRADAVNAQFIELSVFDSGPGFAQSWLAKAGRLSEGLIKDGITFEEECEAVYACLRKGGTTQVGDGRGNGLFRVLQVVRRAGGFIRFRTGRLSGIKVFGASGQNREEDDDIRLLDFIAGGQPKARAWAEGTTITALLPLNMAVDQ